MTVKFLEGSYAEELLEAVALCGEYPWSGLDMMERDRTMLLRALKKVRNDYYMSVSGSAEMKTIRFTKKGLTPLYEHGEKYLDHYLSMSEGHKFRGGSKASGNSGAIQTWRRHRMAEILMTLKYLGVAVWNFDKPELLLERHDSNLISQNKSYFYTSVQLKNADKASSKKVGFTRIMGALFSPGGIYCVYHTNKGLIRWQQQGEIKSQLMVEEIARYNCDKVFDAPFQAQRAIMFGKSMGVALEILNSNGGKRMQNNFELLSFDNTYKNIHFVTFDKGGKIQLKILMTENWQEKCRKVLFDQNVLLDDHSSVDADAKIDNTYVLSFIDGDIGRLKKFKSVSMIMPSYQFQVICFPWQEEMVKNYIGDVTTHVIEADLLLEKIQEVGNGEF